MPAERIPSLQTPTYYAEGSFVRKDSSRPAEREGTAAWIDYFDSNWKKEGLPFHWYTLRSGKNKVGFMMGRQMDAFRNLTNVKEWAKKTKRDLQGFKLEFLSDHIVYPRKYQIVRTDDPNDPVRLEDPMYGKSMKMPGHSPDIQEVVDPQERNGSIHEAMGKIKIFMAKPDTPVGSMTVLASPSGPSGLQTDEGKGIDYFDSYFFIKVKTSPTEVINYTIKTDFLLPETRAVIERLTGEQLTKDSPLKAYANALARIKPGERGINTINDIIGVLEQARPGTDPFVDPQSGKVSTWRDVRDDIVQGERLYGFDQMTSAIIDEFTAYAEEEPPHTPIELQKAIAVAILRMGEQFFDRQQSELSSFVRHQDSGRWIVPPVGQRKFGETLKDTAARPGCSGGGSKTTAVETGGSTRLGNVGEDQYGSRNFDCPECGKKNTRPEGEILIECQHCQSKSVSC